MRGVEGRCTSHLLPLVQVILPFALAGEPADYSLALLPSIWSPSVVDWPDGAADTHDARTPSSSVSLVAVFQSLWPFSHTFFSRGLECVTMRVLLPDGEEKGNNPSFAPVATATPGNDDDAAGLGPSPQQHLPVSPRADLPPQPHPRAPSREAAAGVLRRRANGKQRPTAVAEPSKDNIALEGNVDDGRDVSTANAAQGFRPAARTSACDAA